MAERIREHGNKAVRQQRDEKQGVLQQEKVKSRTLRDELAELRVTLARVTSENATLMLKNKQLEAINSSANVTLMPTQKG